MPAQRGDYGERDGSAHRRTTVTPLPTNYETQAIGEMEAACYKAFEKMAWLKDTDAITQALIIRYAKLMDGPEGAYMTMKMGPHLVEALKQVAATPFTRMMLFGNEKTVSGKLAELREKRGA